MIQPSDVTIIVPHLGTTKEQEYALEQCLISLKETFSGKIILACNGSGCEHSEGYIGVSTLWFEEQGQCKIVNAAVATVNTPWVLVTNDDMIYPPGWFEKLTTPPPNMSIQEYQQKVPMLCLSPKLIEPRPGAPTFEVYFCGGAGGDFDKQKFLDFAKNYQGQGLRTGFNLPFLIKKEFWDLIGGYDVNFDPFGSNGDSCLQTRIMLAGIQPYQNTECIVYHFGQTSGTFHPDNRAYWQKNWDYYIQKYGFERKSSPDIWISQNIIDYEKLKFKPDWMGKYAKNI